MLAATLFALTMGAPTPVHVDQPGLAIRPAPLGGFPLCIWNDSSLFGLLRPGMREAGTRLFRFPNGSLSNEYHWNGQGSFSDDSVWMASDSSWSKGFMGETRHRGTSKSSYGFVRASRICDGDTNTFWWSQPDHPDAPGWFDVDLGAARTYDSMELWLGALRPDSVQILKWGGASGVYPGPHQQWTGWTEIGRFPASGHDAFALPAGSARYLAVRPIGSPTGGWQVREFKLHKAGVARTVNDPAQTAQTQVVASSAHAAIVRDADYRHNWDFQAFMDWIETYPGADPMICVNYGTGTAQEAAAWVKYANRVKGYGIKRWQVGNEMSGPWEEGGPVNARQYAVRYLKFAKAMKSADTTILVYGPVYASANFVQEASGNFDGRSWMEGFLKIVDSAEKRDGARYLDGVDFHTYPYWFADAPDRAAMLAACDGNGAQFDSLAALLARTIKDPASREILMTEYNTSTVSSSVEQEAAGGAASGLQLAHFVQRFGNRGGAVLWDLYEGGGTGPDGTFGTLAAFNKPVKGATSNLGYPPNASFWPLRTLLREWLDPAGGDTLVPVDQIVGVRLFAVRNRGRVAVVGFNLGGDSAAVALDPALFPDGEILSWGEGEYKWNGTTVTASAHPNNGPSGQRIPSTWGGSFKIPPFGIVVVRRSAARKDAARNVHLLASRRNLMIGDTLRVSGWATAPGRRFTAGKWSTTNANGGLSATDGTWDASVESWTLALPTMSLGEGSWTIRFALAVEGGDTLRDTLAVRVDGALRQTLLVSDFDNQKAVTSWNGKWTQFGSGDTGTGFDLAIDSANGLGSSYLRVTADIVQPADLGYANFVSTAFPIAASVFGDSTRNLVGLAFDYRATHSSPTGGFRLLADSRQVVAPNYDVHAYALPATGGTWAHLVVMFSDLQQAGWGAAVGPLDPTQLTRLEFRADGAGAVALDLDNVHFVGTRGTGVAAPPRRKGFPPGLSLRGQKLLVGTLGRWTLRTFAADGRVVKQQAGQGVAELALERTPGPTWAVLESNLGRRVLALPPMGR